VLAIARDDWEAPVLTGLPATFAQSAFASLRFEAHTGPIYAIDHVQIAIPKGGEAAAQPFYRDLMGLVEVPKPATLAGRGGAWYEAGPVHVHLGIEEPFRANDKAHVAFLVDDVGALAARAQEQGYKVKHVTDLETHVRAFIYDPFGNRIEILRPQP
jgi:catechol 2,3-dioxygenase-like lactoylglutathione lyase family enzyme